MESVEITLELLQKQYQLNLKMNESLMHDGEVWRLEYRSLWLKDRDRKPPFFHNQEKLHLNKNLIRGIQDGEGNKITSSIAI